MSEKIKPGRICLLHPGKTGGTYLKSVIRHNKSNWSRPIKLMTHRETVASTLEKFGPKRKLAFSFRDPLERFVSAFHSRLRQGRPTYNRNWSPAEATSFLFFETANDLAEALSSRNERTLSAAYFAFNSILHIKTNYSHHFESPKRLAEEAGNIVACIDVDNFDTDLPAFLTRLGIKDVSLPEAPRRHANPDKAAALSDRAVKNLKTYWAQEFEFFEEFKKIETSQA